MTRERANRWIKGVLGGERERSAEKLASAANGFPGTRQNDSVRVIPRVHVGNVGSGVSSGESRLKRRMEVYPTSCRHDLSKYSPTMESMTLGFQSQR